MVQTKSPFIILSLYLIDMYSTNELINPIYNQLSD